MQAIVHAADVQDRDGGVLLMASLFGLYPFLLKLYADGGYQGAGFQDGLKKILSRVNVEIVKRSDQAKRFVVLPKRWISSAPCLARAMPKAGQGLGMPQSQSARIRQARVHPSHVKKAMQSNMIFPDKLKPPNFSKTIARMIVHQFVDADSGC